jgi:RNase P subunit RPR2
MFHANDNGDESVVWSCSCGHLLFYVIPDGFECEQCGTIASFDEAFGTE